MLHGVWNRDASCSRSYRQSNIPKFFTVSISHSNFYWCRALDISEPQTHCVRLSVTVPALALGMNRCECRACRYPSSRASLLQTCWRQHCETKKIGRHGCCQHERATVGDQAGEISRVLWWMALASVALVVVMHTSVTTQVVLVICTHRTHNAVGQCSMWGIVQRAILYTIDSKISMKMCS